MKITLARSASYVGALILLTLVSFWRIPATAQGVVWAEDGAVFLTDALNPTRTFTPIRPYAGYLHVVPRLAAEVVVRFFALEDYAIALTVLACAAVAGVALMTYHCAQALTSNTWIRVAWAAVPIFVNVGAFEALGNFANLHWYLLWLTPWLLMKPAKSKLEGGMLFVVAALASLTEIISIVFVPLFLYRLRDKNMWAARAGLSLGLACQVIATVTHPRTSGGASYQLDPWSPVYGWFINTAGPIVYGTASGVMQQIVNFGAAPMIVASLLVLAVPVAVLILGSAREKWLAAFFITASMVIWVACVASNPAPYLDYATFSAADWPARFVFGRYSVVPTMFVLATVPLLASALARFGRAAPIAALMAFSLLLASMYFPPSTSRNNGPVWAEHVRTARNLCAPASDTDFYDIPTSPVFFKGIVRIPCPILKARQSS
ncbi:hypothetical protein AHiyo8_60190 [Arthrobacter sp. Hiyo8]|uniref:hypothetical protein n=1 Tax=Arthrobacter sp. Hiyo1 TaxID=1588020 RepID=UPI0006839EDC|nr:hypothetical protein [Arthrobacter sp. Hiyo1]BAS17716.1 hypothetical protein AHiyo8_60190 [Arthrobacter sp. Hiyo8]GAP58046.1 hypothetical protein AHiyo1_10170 [Arthrobacter sp. Hiyo1]